MLHSLKISNFRSIKSQEVELAPITIVYGPNASGKSTLLYSPLVLKNIVLAPNQVPATFFNLQYINLGDFERVVFDHQKENWIELGIRYVKNSSKLFYGISLGEKAGKLTLEAEGDFKLKLELAVTFPYPANQQDRKILQVEGKQFEVVWNGFIAEVTPKDHIPETFEKAREIASTLNMPLEMIRKIDFVPLRRGFSQPQYSPVSATPTFLSEGEVATFIAQNQYLEGELSEYLEQITGRSFRTRVALGTSIFTLVTTEKSTRTTIDLINDGFGINQLVYLLTKSLRQDAKLVCIEEPEIHLHPTILRRLARMLVQIAREKEKKFLISTHSEPFLLAFLNLVAKGELRPQDLACYLTIKEGKETHFERQEVQENGQIKGGLSSFMEGELEDIKAFLGVRGK